MRLLSFFAWAGVVALARAATAPSVSETRFSYLPTKISYFGGSGAVLWHDAEQGIVYRSGDAGKTWKAVDGIPKGQAFLLIQHPYDTRQAFILSDGREHWRTTNRGDSWQRFHTPTAPSVQSGGPLDFHADPRHYDYILFTGKQCSQRLWWNLCHDTVYYTTDAFASDVHVLMDVVVRCSWAKATPEISVPEGAMKRTLCIGWDQAGAGAPRPSGRLGARDWSPQAKTTTSLFESDDLFETRRLVRMPEGTARAFMGFGSSRRFLITAASDPTPGHGGELRLFVSTDGLSWARARFPHGELTHENAYTVLDGPRHALLIDVLDAPSGVGTMFVSDASGANFSLSLHGTQRSAAGFVDYEHLATIEGVALVNMRTNTKTQTRITHDEASSWVPLKPPTHDVDGRAIPCDAPACALHLHGLLELHNLGGVFSSTAPGVVMGVGSIGAALRPYAECDTFLSVDAGVTWRMVARHPHKHAFADQGGLLVMAPDAPLVHALRYSTDFGSTWRDVRLPTPITPHVLTTAPDGASLQLLVVGSQARDQTSAPRHMAVHVDFRTLRRRKCTQADLERFVPQTPLGHCLLGRRTWYLRRRQDANCVVGEPLRDALGHQESCPCTDADYECDVGFLRAPSGACEPTTLLPLPPNACKRPGDTFLGPSGYRRIAGDTCQAQGRAKDAPVQRPCAQGAPAAGGLVHTRFAFPSAVAEVLHLDASPRILVRLTDGQVYQSADDGSTWHELRLFVPSFAEDRALQLVRHPYESQHAYIVSTHRTVYFTRDGGASWGFFPVPGPANAFGLAPVTFHPQHADWFIWTSQMCVTPTQCRADAWLSTTGGSSFHRIEADVRRCAFLATPSFAAPEQAIGCESYERTSATPSLRLSVFNLLKPQRELFPHVLGHTVAGAYLIVATLSGDALQRLRMQVSLDARSFAEVELPPSLQLEHRAYTLLDAATRAVFLHVTTSTSSLAPWGDIVKSNGNGTYYAASLAHVNRDALGFVDFERMLGLDGVALANIVANPEDAARTGIKQLQTRITHTDGAHWAPLTPPKVDAHGAPYACADVGCNLHLHGLLERPDVRVMRSSATATGFMLATGNVGRHLAPYHACDTFLTRDGGFSWTEVRKGAHKWAFGDHGSILVLVDDVHVTDTLLYSLDQGLSWQSFRFGERMRVLTIDTTPQASRRQFVLFGEATGKHSAVFVDFSQLLPRKCAFHPSNETLNDFERWSPSEQRTESCLFGQQAWFWRRKRERVCHVGEAPPAQDEHKKCTCSDADFECEFNHYRDAATGRCVLYPNTSPLPADVDAQCDAHAPDYDGYWYERTSVRRVPFSSCEGGDRPDRGTRHRCPRSAHHGVLGSFFGLVAVGAVIAAAYAFWTKRTGGYIALDTDDVHMHMIHIMDRFVGFVQVLWANAVALAVELPLIRNLLQRRERPFSNYHMLSSDEDAEILRDYGSEWE